jgi:hypothetical protein
LEKKITDAVIEGVVNASLALERVSFCESAWVSVLVVYEI